MMFKVCPVCDNYVDSMTNASSRHGDISQCFKHSLSRPTSNLVRQFRTLDVNKLTEFILVVVSDRPLHEDSTSAHVLVSGNPMIPAVSALL